MRIREGTILGNDYNILKLRMVRECPLNCVSIFANNKEVDHHNFTALREKSSAIFFYKGYNMVVRPVIIVYQMISRFTFIIENCNRNSSHAVKEYLR